MTKQQIKKIVREAVGNENIIKTMKMYSGEEMIVGSNNGVPFIETAGERTYLKFAYPFMLLDLIKALTELWEKRREGDRSAFGEYF